MKYELKDTFLVIRIDSEKLETVQDFFDCYIPSRKIQHLLIQNGWITVNGTKAKRESEIINSELSINIYPQYQNYPELENDDIDIRYEDEFIIAVNKEPGILVHDDGGNSITLLDKVRSHYHDYPYTINSIHRLDYKTSGLIIFSKSMVFEPLLNQNLEQKLIKREYIAVVKGKVESGKTFSIDRNIGRDRHDSHKMIISRSGQPARTNVKCLYTDNSYSVLQCQLLTGRTHQIRLHLSSMNLPILNDDLYGINSSRCHNLALCAFRISMKNLLKPGNLEIIGIIPEDIVELIKEIK